MSTALTDQSAFPKTPELAQKLIALAFALFALSSSVVGAWHYSTTYDEPFHRDWNIRLYQEGISERVSVYNYISTTPILLPNIALMDSLEELRSEHFPEVPPLFLMRLPSVFWLGILLLGSYLLSVRITGSPLVGSLTVILLSLEPNLATHSSLVTADVPFATSLVLFLYFLHRFLEKLSLGCALACGVCLGLLFVSKFTAAFVLPFAALFVFISWRGSLLSLAFWGKLLLSTVVLALTAAFVICCFYLWIGVGTPLHEYVFFNPSFSKLQSLLPSLPIPLPYDFISGFDHLSMAAKRYEWNNIILGTWNGQGVWYYYLLLMILKTPIALLLFSVAGTFQFLSSCCIKSERNWKVISLFFLATVLFVHFSLFVKVQVGYRYVLMTIPLFGIVAATGLKRLPVRPGILVVSSLVVAALSLLELYPYSVNRLSFTNSLISPKKDAYRYIADSNIDWGQNREAREALLREAGYGEVPLNPTHILPGANVFPVNQIIGVFWNFKKHAWVRENLDPIRHFNHTELLYQVSKQDFLRYLSEERMAAPVCELPDEESFISIASEEVLKLPKRTTDYPLSLTVERGGAVRLQNLESFLEFGAIGLDGECRKGPVESKMEAWYFIPRPGIYLFCASSKSGDVKLKMTAFTEQEIPQG